MALTDDAFSRLCHLQELCTSIEDDASELDTWLAVFPQMLDRYRQLTAGYQQEWLKLTQDNSLSAEQSRALAEMLPEGRYSVTGEDTIWDALAAMRERAMQLSKELNELATHPA